MPQECPVNPVPLTYVCGFGTLPFREVQNIRSRTHVRGVLWYGAKTAPRQGNENALEAEPVIKEVHL